MVLYVRLQHKINHGTGGRFHNRLPVPIESLKINRYENQSYKIRQERNQGGKCLS